MATTCVIEPDTAYMVPRLSMSDSKCDSAADRESLIGTCNGVCTGAGTASADVVSAPSEAGRIMDLRRVERLVAVTVRVGVRSDDNTGVDMRPSMRVDLR